MEPLVVSYLVFDYIICIVNEININPDISVLVPQLSIAGIIALTSIILGILYNTGWILIGVVIVVYIVAMPFYLKRTKYIIDDTKIIKNRNFGGEVHEEVRFDKIQNTEIKKPFFYKLLGEYGIISISTAGSDMSALKLKSIDNAKEIHRVISNRAENSYEDTSDVVEGEEQDPNNLYVEYKKLRKTTDDFKKQVIGGKYD